MSVQVALGGETLQLFTATSVADVRTSMLVHVLRPLAFAEESGLSGLACLMGAIVLVGTVPRCFGCVVRYCGDDGRYVSLALPPSVRIHWAFRGRDGLSVGHSLLRETASIQSSDLK